MDPIASTARWTAAVRARESERPDRLFEDPLAKLLAGTVGFASLDVEPEYAKDNPYIAIRTRYFDDWLQEVTSRDGLRQLVMLGVGMDSRAFRLQWPDGLNLWELDREELLSLKQSLLSGTDAKPRCDRRIVAVDLERKGWSQDLIDAGFLPHEPSAWVAEGFFEYFEADAVERILAEVTELAAPESRFGADFLSRDFLNHEWMKPYLQELARRGTPWRFGTNDPEGLLARHHWRPSVKEPGEERAHFGRWPWPVVPRRVAGPPRSFLLTAVKDSGRAARSHWLEEHYAHSAFNWRKVDIPDARC